jgi:drug/metabolite transporter (DMT)-like permease
LIFSPWRSANEIATWGGLAFLAASASYGVSYVYMGRFLAGRGIAPVVLSASQLAAGALLMVLALPLGGLAAPHWRTDALVSLLILSVFGTGVAYVLNYRLIGDEGSTVASTTTYLLPVVAVVLGAVVIHERVTLAMVAGMVVVLVGVALVQRRPARASERASV